MVCALEGQTERGHVLERLAEQPVKLFVACLNLDHRVQPFRHGLNVVGSTLPDAILKRVEMLLAILERVEQADVPSIVRLKRDVEAEAPVGRNSLASCT